MKFEFSNFEIFSTDEKGKHDITYYSDTYFRKKVKINGIAISLLNSNDLKMNDSNIKIKKVTPKNIKRTNTTSSDGTQTLQSKTIPNNRKKPGLHIDYLREEYTEQTYKTLKDIKTTPYLIRPLDVRISIQILTKELKNEPKKKFLLKLKKPLIIILNKHQREYLSKLGKHLKSLEIIRSNLHIRPTVLFRNNRLEWFRYAVKAIIEQNKKLKFNFKKSSQKLTLQNKYISLYKKKQKIVQ